MEFWPYIKNFLKEVRTPGGVPEKECEKVREGVGLVARSLIEMLTSSDILHDSGIARRIEAKASKRRMGLGEWRVNSRNGKSSWEGPN